MLMVSVGLLLLSHVPGHHHVHLLQSLSHHHWPSNLIHLLLSADEFDNRERKQHRGTWPVSSFLVHLRPGLNECKILTLGW
jgi:hypothetical protein